MDASEWGDMCVWNTINDCDSRSTRSKFSSFVEWDICLKHYMFLGRVTTFVLTLDDQ